MNVFEIIVGCSTVLSLVVSIVALFKVNSLNSRINKNNNVNSGRDNNSQNMRDNYGTYSGRDTNNLNV